MVEKRKRGSSQDKVESTETVVDTTPVEVKKGGKVRLSSRVDYPITIKYGEESIRISPRSKMYIEDSSKLEELPSGILLKTV